MRTTLRTCLAAICLTLTSSTASAPLHAQPAPSDEAEQFDVEGSGEAPAAEGSGEADYGDTFEPDYGDTFEPDYGDTFEPDYGDTFEPDYGDTFEPEVEPDYGDTFEPDYGDTFEPDYGDTFEPEVEPDYGDTFEPDYGDTFEPEVEPDQGEQEEDLPAWLLDDEEEDDENWDSLWEQIEPDEPAGILELTDTIAAGMGRVIGVVMDNESSDPLYGTEVSIDGTEQRLTTGADGRFAFEIEPGTWVLRFRNLAYKPEAYEVQVEPDTTTDLASVRLVVDEDTMMTIVVEARADRTSIAAQTVERRESATVQDAVSAQQIQQSGDGSASGAVRRVVGATIVDGRFLFVRGLGGRYTNVTLNGTLVPKTDPVYPGVELDIFPTDLLSSLTLFKNFTPELEGNFVGGLMDIRTRSYPEELEVSVGLSLSGDTMTTFRPVNRSHGGGLDWLGFDDGTRALPDAVPTDRIVVPASIRDPDGLTNSDIEDIAESFTNRWASREWTALPNIGVDASVGDSVELGGDRALGYLASFQYSVGTEHRDRGGRRTLNAELIASDVYGVEGPGEVESTAFEAVLGALGTVTLELAENHDVTALVLYNHQAVDEVEQVRGFSAEEAATVARERVQFIERQMIFAQLFGSHRRLLVPASPWHQTQLDWRFSYADADRDEPDTRYMFRTQNQDGETYRWRPNPGSGERFFSTLQQYDVSGGVDLRLPWRDRFEMRFGGSAQSSRRTFDGRRFRYIFQGSDATVRDLPTDELFAGQNIGIDAVWFSETTQGTDSYVATQLLLGGYARFEVRPTEWLRIVAGARYESSMREIDAGTGIVSAPDSASGERDEADVLPAGGLVFTVADDMYVRANYGATLARPEVSEFAPFVTQDYVRRQTLSGNPSLRRTLVHNADLRWEWFPTPLEVVSATAFYKNFSNPIESVVVSNSPLAIVFQNVDQATSLGGEVEGRISLGRIHDRLDQLVFGGNITLVHSEVRFPCTPREDDPEQCQERYTNPERAMDGQSPFVINLSLGWEERNNVGPSAFLFYNVFGRRISDVGTLGRPDTYDEPIHQLDASFAWRFDEHWKLGFRARNLLLQSAQSTLGSQLVEIERRPLELSLSVGWDL